MILEKDFKWFEDLMEKADNEDELLNELKEFVKTDEYWADEWTKQINQFGAMHALSFV